MAISALCLGFAVYTGELYPLLIPAAAIAGMAIVARFEWMYFLLMSLLVVSVEMEMPGFTLDFPSELLMLAFMFVGPLFFIANKEKVNKAFFNHPLFLALVIHFVWIGVASLFSLNQLVSLKYFLAKTWYIIAFTVMGGWFIRDHKDFKTVFWAVMLPMALVVLWTLNNFREYGFDFEFVNKTMHPIYHNHVDYGVILAMMMPFTLILRNWYRSGGLVRLVIDSCSLLFLVGIVYSYTRAAYVSLLIIPVAWFMFKHRLTKTFVYSGLVLLFLGVGYLSIGNKYLDFAPDFANTIYHPDFSDHLSSTIAFEDVSTMERVYRWVAGFNMSTEYPLTGFGPNCFNRFYRNYTTSMFTTYVSANEEQSTVHNYYLMTLVEQGVPGFVIFLVLCVLLVLYSERIYHNLTDVRDKQLALAISIALLMFLANNFMADLVEIDEIGSFFFLFIAMLINLDLKTKGKTWVAR